MTSAHHRSNDGLTIHRSETHAQGQVDTLAVRSAQLIRRSKREGRASTVVHAFKPLGGNPKGSKAIQEMAMTEINKSRGILAAVGINAGHGVAGIGPAKRFDVEGPSAEWHGSGDAKAGAEGEDAEDREGENDSILQQQRTLQPQTLFGKDLPRCQGRHKSSDGFRMLRQFVQESENRVQQTRTLVPGTAYGLDYSTSMLDYLMPPRADYPPVVDKRHAAATLETPLPPSTAGSSGRPPPLSARTPRAGERANAKRLAREIDLKAKNCPGRPAIPQAYRRQVYVSPVQKEMRPRPLPITLPSLTEFIESSGPSMGGRAERGEVGRVRQQINLLLKLDRNTTLKLPTEEIAGVGGVGRRDRINFRRKLEKQLNEAWRDRNAYKRCITNPGGPVDENRFENQERTAATGNAGAEEVTLGGEGKWTKKKREWSEAEEAEAYAKVVAFLRESDPSISPVARLRSSLQQYQKSRDTQLGNLQSALYSMDADRLNALKRRAMHLQPRSEGPAADAKTSCALMRIEAEKDMLVQHMQNTMQNQYLWYRELWHHVQNDKRELPPVAHFVFDFLKQVLEYGEVFTQDMYFAMLSQIENFEYSEIVAKLVVKMGEDIEGVGQARIADWFREFRGQIPVEVAKLTGRPAGYSAALGDEPPLAASLPTQKANPSPFVTELPM